MQCKVGGAEFSFQNYKYFSRYLFLHSCRSYEKDYGDLLEKNKSLQQKLDKMALESEKQQKSLQSKLNAVTTRKS